MSDSDVKLGVQADPPVQVKWLKTREEMFQGVVLIIKEHFRLLSTEPVLGKVRFVADLHGDSLDTVDLILIFEEKFGITIPDEIAETLDTVDQVVDYLWEEIQKVNKK